MAFPFESSIQLTDAACQLIFGDQDTYFEESADDVLDLYVGDTHRMTFQEVGINIGGDTVSERVNIEAGHLRFNAVTVPSTMTVALAGLGAGNVDDGLHYYGVEFICESGDTGDPMYSGAGFVSVTVTNNTTDGQVSITNIPTGTPEQRVTGRRILRTVADAAGGYQALVLHTINDNTTTTYTDNIADSGLTGSQIYRRINATAADIFLGTSPIFRAPSIFLTAVGVGAGQAVTTGHSMVIMGGNAGDSITSGSSNTLFGYSSGTQINTGNGNIGMGYASVYYVTGGSSNIGIGGSYAMRATGSHNIGIGDATIRNAAVNYSIGIGRYALRYLDGDYNVALGILAGEGAADTGTVTGTHNILIGYLAGGDFGSTADKSYNVFVGRESGRYVDSSNNTAVGSYTLSALTTGGTNTAFGYSAASNLTTGIGNLHIGYDVDASAVGVDYEFRLGYNATYLLEGNMSGTIWVGTDYDLRTDVLAEFTASAGIGVETNGGTAIALFEEDRFTVYQTDTPSSLDGILIHHTGDDAYAGQFTALHERTTGQTAVANDDLMWLEGAFYDAAGTPVVNIGARLEFEITDVTLAAEEVRMNFFLMSGGNMTNHLILSGDGAEYLADHSTAQSANDRWIPDKAYVDSQVGGVGDVSWGTETGEQPIVIGANAGDIDSISNITWTPSTYQLQLKYSTTPNLTLSVNSSDGNAQITWGDGLRLYPTIEDGKLATYNGDGNGSYFTVRNPATTPVTTLMGWVDGSGTDLMAVNENGTIYMYGLGDDDTEDHLIAIDDSTGLLTKRSVASITGGNYWTDGTGYLIPNDSGDSVRLDGTTDAGFYVTTAYTTGMSAAGTTGSELRLHANNINIMQGFSGWVQWNVPLQIANASPSLTFNSGDAVITTGDSATTPTNSITITTGDATEASPGDDSGDLYIYTGASTAGTRGSIYLGDGATNLGLTNDEAETNVVAIDTTTGLLTYRSVSSIGGTSPWQVNSNVITTSTAGDDLRLASTEHIQFGSASDYITGTNNNISFYTGTTIAFSITNGVHTTNNTISPASTGGASLGSSTLWWYGIYTDRLFVDDTGTYIQRDGSGNMIFSDSANTDVTLTELLSGLWTSDTNGITYTAGNVGIGVASSATYVVDVGGDSVFRTGSEAGDEGLYIEHDYTAANMSSSILFNEGSVVGQYGMRIMYAGDGVQDFGSASMTYATNTGYIIMHDNDTTGEVAISIARTTAAPSLYYDGTATMSTITNGIKVDGTTSTIIMEGSTTSASTGAVIRMVATATARARGIQYENDADATEWFCGIGYNVGGDFIIGYDASGGQPEYSTGQILRINSSENVGINRDPAYKLDITGSSDTITARLGQSSVSGSGGWLRLQNTSTGQATGAYAGRIDFYKDDASTQGAGTVGAIYSEAIDSGGTYNLYFKTGQDVDTPAGTNSTMYLTYTGELYLDAAQNAILSLDAGTTSYDSYIRFSEAGSTVALMGWDTSANIFQIHTGTAFQTSANGDFSISTGGTIYMGNISNNAYTNYLRYDSSTSAVGWYSSSDIRLKENIELWERDSLTFLMAQKIIEYDRKDGSMKGEIGWDATQMRELMPDMTWVEGRRRLVNFKEAHMPLHFHQAIKQLGTIAETHEEKIQRLEEKVVKLNEELELLKNKE